MGNNSNNTNSSNGRTGSPGGVGGAGRDWRHLATLFESLPPHAIEAEMSLLGSILIEPQVLGDVIFIVKKGDEFFKPANGAIFDAMIALYDKHSSLDIVQLNQLLVDRNILDGIGGLDYLVQLANAVPSAANAQHYARLVREKATVRQLISAAGDILYDAYHSPEESQLILDRAESLIFHIAQQTETAPIENLHQLIIETMKRIEANLGRDITGLSTGFLELDTLTTGFQPGEMVIIAARPAMGKTALALNIAEHVALSNRAIGIFSLEMSKQQLVQRLLCARSGVNSQRLRRNMLQDEEFKALQRACDQLIDAPILIDDSAGLSLLGLRAKARRMASKHKIDAIIIDYLQLMSTGGRVESRQVEVGEISRGVKAMARELNVPVICLSQLNRGAEDRVGNRPRMSDLRESGSLEQDADVVILLHREEYYHKDDENWKEEMDQFAMSGQRDKDLRNVAELIIAKQRNGPTETVKLTWVPEITRFKNWTSASKPPGIYEPKVMPEPAYQSARRGGGGSSSRSGGGSSIAVQNFRDGGGPDRDDQSGDDDIPI